MGVKTVYRIELPFPSRGMWYDENGNFDPIIHELCPDAVAKDFPMGVNPIHRKDGKIWYSAGKDIACMNYWFSREDALLLAKNGFKLYEFYVNEYQELEHEMLFTREGVIWKREIDINSIWGA